MNKFMKTISVITMLIFLRTGFALAAEQVYFYYTDPAGTPLAMTDTSGTVVWRAAYLPFGEEMIGTSTVQNNKMFVGKERDSETGLLYFGARYMDSVAGRFTSPDPVGAVDPRTGMQNLKRLLDPQRLNVYVYTRNNPYAFLDPDGKELMQVRLLGLTTQDPVLRERTYLVEASMADDFVGFATEARREFSQLSVNNIYRSEDSSSISTSNTRADGLSNHQAGTAIDLNGVGTLGIFELEVLNKIASRHGLAPIRNQREDLPHFERDPRKIGYDSLEKAVQINKEDYDSKSIRFQTQFILN